MWQLIGLVGVFVTIGVGYTIAGGHFGVIIEAVGPELLVILGPGAMTLLISNEMSTVKSVPDVIALPIVSITIARSSG